MGTFYIAPEGLDTLAPKGQGRLHENKHSFQSIQTSEEFPIVMARIERLVQWRHPRSLLYQRNELSELGAEGRRAPDCGRLPLRVLTNMHNQPPSDRIAATAHLTDPCRLPCTSR